MQYISSQAQVDMDFDHEDHPLAMANWGQHSNHTFMKFVFQQQTDNSRQQVSNQQLAVFKNGIKREVSSCPTLKDERSFSKSLYITTNLMSVMKFWTLTINLVQKIKSYLKINKFLCFQCLTHIC